MSRFILVAMALAVTVAGCDRFPHNGLQIAAMLPPNDSCVFVDNIDIQLLGGVYDVSVSSDYVIAPLLKSYLYDNGTDLQAQPANLQVTNFEMTLLLEDGTKLELPENPYSTTTSLVITANQSRGGVSQGVAAGVGIPVAYQDALRAITPAPGEGTTTILLDVRAIGTTVGGFTQRSARFTWPIELCNGCRILPFCPSEDADEPSCCTLAEAAASCLPGQDVWPACVH